MKRETELEPRQKLLLLFLDSGSPKELDPIKIMKGLFLVSKEAPQEWIKQQDRYDFTPYYYGPCSFQIYSDLARLEEFGYIISIEVQGQSWKYYALTREGKERIKKFIIEVNPNLLKYLEKIREFVTILPFRNLLAVIYKRYPHYSTKSVFQF
jgi:DNA-binding PadR family transcriptional regulator